MSIKAFSSNQIDIEKWDDLVHASDNMSVCAEYWYIDLICNKNWWAFINEDKMGNYVSAMPVFLSKKMGNRFSRQPLLSKYWGPIIRLNGNGNYQKQHFAKDQMALLLNESTKVAVFDYFSCIEPLYTPQYLWQKINVSPRFTYLIDLQTNIDNIRLGYSKTVRKKVNKLKKEGFENVLKQNSDDLEHMIVLNLNEGRELVPAQAIEPLKQITQRAIELNKGYFLSTLSPNGEIAAAGFFLFNKKYTHFLSGYVNPKYRNQNAMNLLVDGALNRSTAFSEQFDFFGSQIESIEAFFRSFGAYHKPYYRLVKAKFPFNFIWKA